MEQHRTTARQHLGGADGACLPLGHQETGRTAARGGNAL
jgi:hypothetical protein